METFDRETGLFGPERKSEGDIQQKSGKQIETTFHINQFSEF